MEAISEIDILIREAMRNWRSGELSDLSTLIVIDSLIMRSQDTSVASAQYALELLRLRDRAEKGQRF